MLLDLVTYKTLARSLTYLVTIPD
uniref:Uncharacterized protein n=1 Tax=Arundo donax TaxID=35708 RepID=A0A0A8ZEI1_ARUDO